VGEGARCHPPTLFSDPIPSYSATPGVRRRLNCMPDGLDPTLALSGLAGLFIYECAQVSTLHGVVTNARVHCMMPGCSPNFPRIANSRAMKYPSASLKYGCGPDQTCRFL